MPSGVTPQQPFNARKLSGIYSGARIWIALIAATSAVALLVNTSPPSASAASGAGTRVVNAEYKGTYRAEDHVTYTDGAPPGDLTETWTWVETVAAYLDAKTGALVSGVRTIRGAGSFQRTGGGNGRTQICAVQTLKETESVAMRAYDPVDFFDLPNPQLKTLSIQDTGTDPCFPPGLDNGRFLHSDPNTGFGPFGAEYREAWSVAFETDPLRGFIPGGPPVSYPIDVDQSATRRGILGSFNVPTAVDTGSRSIHATMSVRGDPATTGPTTKPPKSARNTPQAVRDGALEQMKLELTRAVYPCLTASTGLVVFGAVPLPAGPIVGSTLVAVAGPICARMLATLKSLELVYNDPPVDDFTVAATVSNDPPPVVTMPPCPPDPPAIAGTCADIQSAALDYLAQTQNVSNVAAALETTVGRESAAATANDSASVTLQQQTALNLLPQLGATIANRRTSGARLAATLTAAGTKIKFTSKQTAQAYSQILKSLAAAGIPEKAIRDALAKALKPVPIDALKALSA